MKTCSLLFCLLILAVASSCTGQTLSGPKGEIFKEKIIFSGLRDPWEIVYGPDNHLWITEAKAYLVSRVNPQTGLKTVLLDLTAEKAFSGKPWPQGGLMGMALHPHLLQGQPYVYLAFTHKFNESKPNYGGHYFNTKIVRFSYDSTSHQLKHPVTICDTIPGSSDHNGGRLLVAPVNGKDYLFYSTGDMGAGQFDNAARPNNAQTTASYEGKILRFNTLPDGDSNTPDSWIPDDNPFNANTQSAVWSYGHRNPQGLAFSTISNQPVIYSTEHGPFGDDELNIIEKGKNYGHPLVIGYTDNNYNGLAAAVSKHTPLPGKWNTSYPFIADETRNVKQIGKVYREPIKSFHPNSNEVLKRLFNATITNQKPKPDWSAIAPSSIAVYTSEAIPAWKNSLLITTLKTQNLIRLQLNPDGKSVRAESLTYFQSSNRYRDIAISPDGLKIYLITDYSSVTSGPTKEDPQGSSHKGAILEFTYQK